MISAELEHLRRENSAMRRRLYNQTRQIKSLCKLILNIKVRAISPDEVEIQQRVAKHLLKLQESK